MQSGHFGLYWENYSDHILIAFFIENLGKDGLHLF
jgi:hypothetical protein